MRKGGENKEGQSSGRAAISESQRQETKPAEKLIIEPPVLEEKDADIDAYIKKGIPAEFPGDVRPMLATLVDEPFDEPGWIYEVKWDGYRYPVNHC